MKLFLLGREFIIQTDHCPLRDMQKKSSHNRRVDRISLTTWLRYFFRKISPSRGIIF